MRQSQYQRAASQIGQKTSEMFSDKEINLYENEIDLRQVISGHSLHAKDEALYVCDLRKLQEMCETWKCALPRVKPYYALKCNDTPTIVTTLAELGVNFDCASKNEIKQVLDLGVEPDRIIFAHPCKPASHLEYAKEHGVMTSTVDTEFEVYKVHKHFPESNIVIRFRCDAKEALCLLGSKYGCDAERDATALMLLAKSLNLKVTGVSFHVGSDCNDLPAYDRAITIASNLFKVGAMIGFEMDLLDIGGGFPGSDDNKFKKIAKTVNESLSLNFADENLKIISEPGRYFVAAAYTLICKIHAKNEARKPAGKLLTKMYYVNDGVYGSFLDCIMYPKRQWEVIHFLDDENGCLPKFKSLIWGPTCDARDKIIKDLLLPDLKCGDFLGFLNMGAYTLPVATTFNGFVLPKTIFFKKRTNIKTTNTM